MVFRTQVFLALFIAVLAGPLAAHPHVWADVRAEVTVAGGYVEGVWTTWTFEDVFSQLIRSDHDTDGNGRFSPEETTLLKKGYFDHLKVYRWFTHLALGSTELEVPEPQNFQATITPEGRVCYRFFFPLGLRLGAKVPLAFAFYDDTFFTDMVFQKSSPVILKVTDGGQASVSIRPDKTKTYFAGLVTPVYSFITWSLQ